MANVESFLPVADPDARVLIVGSMPGIASLEAQRYYAHPRNSFWPIMASICGFDAGLPYEQRLASLRQAKVALWDVLASCAREGSLDSDIVTKSIRANDFAGFLVAHSDVRAVLCNGGTAYRMFRQRVLQPLLTAHPQLLLRQLPSTSPAHASMTRQAKLEAWAGVLRPLLV